VDIATAFESFAQLFPAAQPPSGFKRSRQYSSSQLITAGRAFQLGLGFPESFLLGAGQVIPAWNAASRGCRGGSRVLLVLPPGLAYGQAGDPPDVDGHDTLVFVVDILAAL
jgi:FKBP-type peptidyl-prolyl cis-trans isomerase